MRHAFRLIPACLLAALAVAPPRFERPAVAAPALAFNDCGYQSEMYALVASTSKLYGALWKMQTSVFHQQQTQLLTQLNRIDTRYTSSRVKEARTAYSDVRSSLLTASDAVDGRDAGVYAVWTAKMKTAYQELNAAYTPLKTFCALGHPAGTQIDVSLTGGEYANGVAPMPVAPPWLAVSRKWAIHWSYTCYGAPYGFRIEVRAIRSKVPLVFTNAGDYATSLYLGPVLAVPVSLGSKWGSGTATLNGLAGPVYLIVRTRCASSIQVVG